MNTKNPCYIPRNHLIEDALKQAINDNMTEINLMSELLKKPFEKKNEYNKYTLPSPNEKYVTYCGT